MYAKHMYTAAAHLTKLRSAGRGCDAVPFPAKGWTGRSSSGVLRGGPALVRLNSHAAVTRDPKRKCKVNVISYTVTVWESLKYSTVMSSSYHLNGPSSDHGLAACCARCASQLCKRYVVQGEHTRRHSRSCRYSNLSLAHSRLGVLDP